jgi:hypothetical protein
MTLRVRFILVAWWCLTSVGLVLPTHAELCENCSPAVQIVFDQQNLSSALHALAGEQLAWITANTRYQTPPRPYIRVVSRHRMRLAYPDLADIAGALFMRGESGNPGYVYLFEVDFSWQGQGSLFEELVHAAQAAAGADFRDECAQVPWEQEAGQLQARWLLEVHNVNVFAGLSERDARYRRRCNRS